MISIISLYKNKVEQTPGWKDSVLRWCAEEAKKRCLNEKDYYGGFVIDEMKIQVSLYHNLYLFVAWKLLLKTIAFIFSSSQQLSD